MKEVIFIIQGFEKMQPTGSLDDVTVIEVYAKTEKEAIASARKYIKKAFYRVSQVIEKKENAST